MDAGPGRTAYAASGECDLHYEVVEVLIWVSVAVAAAKDVPTQRLVVDRHPLVVQALVDAAVEALAPAGEESSRT